MDATTYREENEGTELVRPQPLSGVTELSTVREAAKFMSSYRVGAAGIYSKDAHHLIGILTERDVTRAVAENLDPDRSCVVEIMSSDLVIADAPLTLDEARTRMKVANVRHLVVRSGGGDHIVSLRDVIPTSLPEVPRSSGGSAPESIRPGRHRPPLA